MTLLLARLFARLEARLRPRWTAPAWARLRLYARLVVPVGTLVGMALVEFAGRRWNP